MAVTSTSLQAGSLTGASAPGGAATPAVAAATTTTAGPEGPFRVVITSDQSVILPQQGSTYQFAAVVKDATGAAVDLPITWQSSASAAVSVSSAGLATAVKLPASAVVTASATGATPASADVITADPAPGTVMLLSSDVLSVTTGSAVLALNTRTRALKAGDVIVTGSTGGLLATVGAVTASADKLTVTLQPAVLTKAFKSLDIHLTTAADAVETTPQPGAALWPAAAQPVALTKVVSSGTTAVTTASPAP